MVMMFPGLRLRVGSLVVVIVFPGFVPLGVFLVAIVFAGLRLRGVLLVVVIMFPELSLRMGSWVVVIVFPGLRFREVCQIVVAPGLMPRGVNVVPRLRS